jgi:hypothetical protein
MNDINKNLADKTLIDYSNRLTRILLKAEIDINKICLFVKDYQRKYIHIREEGASDELLKAYTPEIWWKMSKTDGGIKIIKKKN